MTRYRITPSTRFKKDLQRARRRGCSLPELSGVIEALAAGQALPHRYKDHPLGGINAGYRECSVSPRCRLVYGYRGDRLVLCLIRTPWLERGHAPFLLTEVRYRLLGRPSHTALLLSVAALLMGVTAFYLGNIQANRAALDSLSGTVRVRAQVVNRTGDRESGLQISPALYEALAAAPVRDLQCTAFLTGAYGPMAQLISQTGVFEGGNVTVRGLNDLPAGDVPEGAVEFRLGWGPGLFTGEEPVCLVREGFAKNYGLRLGDQISLPLFLSRTDDEVTRHCPLGYQTLKVVGIYRPRGLALAAAADLYTPVGWMRKTAEAAGEAFVYDSLSASLAEPMELNRFKGSLKDMGFREVQDTSDDLFIGDAMIIEDEMFIKTAGELQENLEVFNRFMPTFFGVVVGMVTLTTFLVLRGGRRDIAIASSLGRQRALNAASHFLGAFCAELLGCLAALPVMCGLVGVTIGTAMASVGLYMACACAGTSLALAFLLRFDPLSMLTNVD